MLDLDALTVVELDRNVPHKKEDTTTSPMKWPFPLLRLDANGKIIWMSETARRDLSAKGIPMDIGHHIDEVWSIEGGFDCSLQSQVAKSSKYHWTFFTHTTTHETLVSWLSELKEEKPTEESEPLESFQEELKRNISACRKLVLKALVLLEQEDLAAVQQTLLSLDSNLEL